MPDQKVTGDLIGILIPLFTRMGLEVRFIDPAKDAPEADILLLIGRCSVIPRVDELIRQARARGTHVAVWQIEPLPPEWISDRATHPMVRLRRSDRFRMRHHRPLIWRAFHELRYRWYFGQFARLVSGTPAKQVLETEMEVLSTPCREYRWLREKVRKRMIDSVLISLPASHQYLRRWGIPSSHVPMGYDPRWGRPTAEKRDVDVVFLGSVGGRRRAILRRLQAEFSRMGIGFVSRQRCFGEERTKLLNRARISLNITRHAWEFPGMRLLMSLGCRALLVSESCGSTDPYVPGEHFVMADVEKLAGTIRHYLDHEDERARIAEQGFRFVSKRLRMEQTIGRAITDILSKRSRATTPV
jgi:hypothetical protein